MLYNFASFIVIINFKFLMFNINFLIIQKESSLIFEFIKFMYNSFCSSNLVMTQFQNCWNFDVYFLIFVYSTTFQIFYSSLFLILWSQIHWSLLSLLRQNLLTNPFLSYHNCLWTWHYFTFLMNLSCWMIFVLKT